MASSQKAKKTVDMKTPSPTKVEVGNSVRYDHVKAVLKHNESERQREFAEFTRLSMEEVSEDDVLKNVVEKKEESFGLPDDKSASLVRNIVHPAAHKSLESCLQEGEIFLVDDEDSAKKALGRIIQLIEYNDGTPFLFCDVRDGCPYEKEMDAIFNNEIRNNITPDVPEGEKRTVCFFIVHNGQEELRRYSGGSFSLKFVVRNHIREEITGNYRDPLGVPGDGFILWAFDIDQKANVESRYGRENHANKQNDDSRKKNGQNGPMQSTERFKIAALENEIASLKRAFADKDAELISERIARKAAEMRVKELETDRAKKRLHVQLKLRSKKKEVLPTLELPEKAPTLYVNRPVDHETGKPMTIIRFLEHFWGPWIKAGVLTRPELKRRDPQAYMALANHLRNHELPADLTIPTKSEAIDRSAAQSHAASERPAHVDWAIRKRQSRSRQPVVR